MGCSSKYPLPRFAVRMSSPCTQKATDLLFDGQDTASTRATAASQSEPSSHAAAVSQFELDDTQDSPLATRRPHPGRGVRMNFILPVAL